MAEILKPSRRDLLKYSAGVGAALLAGLPRSAMAQTFPSEAINWMVQGDPGGTPDISTRIVEPRLSKILNVPIGVENVPGADGRVARARLYNAKKDGYTMLTDNSNSTVLGELFYDGAYVSEEFEPIYGWERTGYQLCVKKGSPIQTFQDLERETKKRRVVAGTIGLGSDSHLQMLLISEQLGMPMSLVHFEGSGEAYAALLGDHIEVAIAGAGSGSRNAETLHFLCVTNTVREFALPNVPTIVELGYKVDVLVRIWFAMTSPGVPEERVQILSAALEEAFKDEQVKEQLAKAGVSPTVVPRAEIRPSIVKFKESAIKFKDLMTK
jgi:tripartite-type tricarboxylate transporter receptor subunit TctC